MTNDYPLQKLGNLSDADLFEGCRYRYIYIRNTDAAAPLKQLWSRLRLDKRVLQNSKHAICKKLATALSCKCNIKALQRM